MKSKILSKIRPKSEKSVEVVTAESTFNSKHLPPPGSEKLTSKELFKKQLKQNILLILTILGVCVGIGLGFLLRAFTNFSPQVQNYFGVPGELFLRVLQLMILPLISSSLICGIAGLGSVSSGRIAIRAIIFYMCSMISAVVIGLVLSAAIRPGLINRASNITTSSDPLNGQKVDTADTICDLLRNLLPNNLVQIGFTLYQSVLTPVYKTVSTLNATSNTTTTSQVVDYYNVTAGSRTGLNVLGLVVFCIAFGAVVGAMADQKSKVLLDFFETVNEASIRIIRLFMWTSPIGVASLICVAVLEMKDPAQTFKSISFYVMTVLVGLAIQGLIILPLFYLVIIRKNVLIFVRDMSEALLVALATASSAATLPITFRCIEEKHKIPKMISRFVLPVGAIVNLDGTALYEAAAAIFIAQMNDIPLRFVDYLITSVTATLAAVGASGIPSAGLVTMVIVLSALGLPQSQISLIYAVDWLLDRFRTMINVWGDSIGCAVVAHLSRKEVEQHLSALDEVNPNDDAKLIKDEVSDSVEEEIELGRV